MDWALLVGPAVVATFISAPVAIIGVLISTRASRAIHTEKLAFDREQVERKVRVDIYLTEKKFTLDREIIKWKRKVELAEETMASFYEAKEAIEYAREPFTLGDEGGSRAKADWETENDT